MTEILETLGADGTALPAGAAAVRAAHAVADSAAPAGAASNATASNATAPAASLAAGIRMDARAKLVLFVLCAANFMVALDFSILNVALPSIGRDLGLSEANLQWVATAFSLPSGGLLLLLGRSGDLVGRRRVFLGGLGLFTAASLLAAFAWDPALLLAARALQGVGAAAIVPTGMALLTTSFPEGPQRDRALGISGSIMAFGFTIGVVIGGVLTQAFGWRSTMALNVVLGAAVLVAAPLLIGESRNPHHSRLDVPGAATVTGGLLAVIYALTTAAQAGWTRPDVVVTLVAGVLLMAAFIAIEARTAEPLVSLRVLRRRTVALGNLGGLSVFAMASSVVFLGTLFLQQVDGMKPTGSGLVFGYLGLVCAVAGTLAPRVIGRIGAPRVLVFGMIGQGAMTAVIATLDRGDATAVLLIAGTFWGAAHLPAIVAYGVTATSGLPDREQGLATGLATTAQQVGMTVGIPLISAIAAARAGGLARAGHSASDALAGGIRFGLGVDSAIVLVIAALLGVGLLRRSGSAARG
ncbi:MAG TPA: MFS transporter [Actinocrinis sp.]|nr:MFS transporter [Actinocrinis sp.]